MNQKFASIQGSYAGHHGQDQAEPIELYPGIALSYFSLAADRLSMHHEALGHILEINYCRSGRIGWDMGSGNSVYLGEKDFSLHTLNACADSVMTFPTRHYEGLAVSIDLNTLTNCPPEILSGTGITGSFLYDKFCAGITITSFAGDERTESIFSGFYGQPEHLRLSYQKMKVIELLLYLGGLETDSKGRLTEYQSEQVEVIRKIHKQLIEHMDQRFTIESLAKQYLMNPTTLKAVFKSVYGASIAAHIKAHRMEQAARLLRETNMRVAEIAEHVGYDSQSKFTAAFKAAYHTLPTEYRKNQLL